MRRLLSLLLLTPTACDVASQCAPATLAPLPKVPAYAVVASDYGSSAIALLDEDGALVTEAWIDSGTTRTGISSAIGGDVVLPTRMPRTGELTLVDRLGVDVVTRIAVPTGEVLGQIRTQEDPNDPNDPNGFRANPYDVLAWNDSEWLVSRLSPNLRTNASELEGGSDVVRVHLGSGEIARRYDFSAADRTEDGSLFYARPSHFVRLGDRVLVGLGRLNTAFESGPGAVASLDPESGALDVLELDGLENCGEMSHVYGSTTAAFVLCSGETFTTAEGRRSTSGVVRIGLDERGAPVAEAVWRAVSDASSPVPSNGLVALSGARVVVNAMGDRSLGTRDEFVAIDVESGTVDIVFESAGAFVIGRGDWDGERSRLLVPDAADGVHVFDVEGATFREISLVNVSPCRGLPPREVRRLPATPTR